MLDWKEKPLRWYETNPEVSPPPPPLPVIRNKDIDVGTI